MNQMNIDDILKYMPHRYPFLLVDKILECEPGKSIIGIKNVTFNEPYFLGHFPNKPVMPGVLQIEALAQAAGLLIFLTTGRDGDFYYFAGIDNVRFRRIVKPGDQVKLNIKLERNKLEVWKFSAEATVDGELACSAILTLAK